MARLTRAGEITVIEELKELPTVDTGAIAEWVKGNAGKGLDRLCMGIGGLISSATSHGGTKVPILGDIPLLGRLFSSKSVNDEATNLLIFITAKTVSADGASPEEVFDPRAVQAIGMSREDMPGNRTPKGADMFAPASSNKK